MLWMQGRWGDKSKSDRMRDNIKMTKYSYHSDCLVGQRASQRWVGRITDDAWRNNVAGCGEMSPSLGHDRRGRRDFHGFLRDVLRMRVGQQTLIYDESSRGRRWGSKHVSQRIWDRFYRCINLGVVELFFMITVLLSFFFPEKTPRENKDCLNILRYPFLSAS